MEGYSNHSLEKRQNEEDVPAFTEGQLDDIREVLEATQPVLDELIQSVRADLQSGAIASVDDLGSDDLYEKWNSAVSKNSSVSVDILETKGEDTCSVLEGLVGRFMQSHERVMKSKNPSLEDMLTYLRCCLFALRTPEIGDIKLYIKHILGGKEGERGKDRGERMLQGFNLAEALKYSKDPETVAAAKAMLMRYGLPEAEADKHMRDCVHEVNRIFNRHALAWVILPSEGRRIDAMDCEKEKAVFCSGIIFLDLDGLKSFNDILKKAIGMDGGDFYLDKVCEVVQNGETTGFLKSLGVQVEAVRWGGDEFIVHVGVNPDQGTLQKFGEDGINIGEVAIKGIEGKVQGYEAEIEGLDISELMSLEVKFEGKPMTVQKYMEKKLKASYKKAEESGYDPGFPIEEFDNYQLSTGASGGYAYFGEVPKENWGPYTGGNPAEQLKQFLRVFVRELITIASSRADAVKSRKKSGREESDERRKEPGELKRQRVDRWVRQRIEELSKAETRIRILQDANKMAKQKIEAILQRPFFREQ